MSRTRPEIIMIKRGPKRLIMGLALAALFLLSACALVPPAEDGIGTDNGPPFILRPQNEKYFREDEWVRIITLAISNPDQRDKIWESIPSAQRSEISQSDFLRYAGFLNDCLPGTISSFYRATDEESETMRVHASKSEKQLTPKPSQAAFWWIKARTSDLREIKFAVPVTLDESGIPYFSKSWLQRQASLYDYVVLYLDALSTGSGPALSSLLRHNLDVRTDAQDYAIERRVKDLLAYYSTNVVSGRGGYRCVEMMPGRAVFEELLLTGDTGNQRSRTVVFTETGGSYRADEKIPQILDQADSVLFFREQVLFEAGESGVRILSSSSIKLLGIPLSLDITGEDEKGDTIFRVTWPGLEVEALGSCDPDSLSFDGMIRQIYVSYSRFETGSGLRPGNSIHELYLRYPFARENGYLIQDTQAAVSRTLAVQLESDYIARLTLIFD